MRRVGHGLAVVAGRGCHHAALALGSAQLGNEVDAAAHLECAYGLIVFVFDKGARAKQLINGRVGMERRARQVRANLAAGQ